MEDLARAFLLGRRCRYAKVHVVLDQQLRLGPFHSKIVKASASNTSSDLDICIKMVTPNDKLASIQCDFTEVWKKKCTGELQVTN